MMQGFFYSTPIRAAFLKRARAVIECPRDATMANSHKVTINGNPIRVESGELLLDAALKNGVDLPHDCRAGHCGTCCVRLVSGAVRGGKGAEPGIVHACQCRVVADAVVETGAPTSVRSVQGKLASLRPLSRDVMEVGITTERALPHHAGQYVQVSFDGYPSRPFSITHPVDGNPTPGAIWLHVRRMQDGRVTPWLGKRIKPGHRVTLKGPHGAAHFHPNLDGRLILVATNTGFAPIWSIAVAALRENPERKMMVVVGGRSLDAIYMGPALLRLASFPGVLVVPVCSTPQTSFPAVRPGRPTDYLPELRPTDVIYACGAPGMVDAVKAVAARYGAACHADPFLTTAGGTVAQGVLTRTLGWLALDGPRGRRERQAERETAKARGHYRSESA